MKRFKTKISFLTLGLIMILLFKGMSVSAESNGTAQIPPRMEPYTIIEYVSEDEYVILQGGEAEPGKYNENGLTDEEQKIIDERREMIHKKYPGLPEYSESYPLPVEGMRVTYDNLGEVFSIDSPIAKHYNPLPRGTTMEPGIYEYPENTKRNAIIVTEGGRVHGIGRLTTFSDYIGESNNVLKKGDCATKGEKDNPVHGQQILVFAHNRNTGAWEYYIFLKMDNGDLPDAILDIWKTGVEYWGYTFSENFSIDNGEYTYTYSPNWNK